MGYSLGANLLVKYLGEEGKHGYHPLAGAVAVSNPWNFENNSVGGGTPKGFVETLLGKFYSLALTVGLKVKTKARDVRCLALLLAVAVVFFGGVKYFELLGDAAARSRWDVNSARTM